MRLNVLQGQEDTLTRRSISLNKILVWLSLNQLAEEQCHGGLKLRRKGNLTLRKGNQCVLRR